MTTDKVTLHGFDRFYKPLIDTLVRQSTPRPPAMIEIGVQKGESIPFWRALAPTWTYVGADKDADDSDQDGVLLRRVDQSKVEHLLSLRKSLHSSYSILFVNDDGSHLPEHQILTFNLLFPLLENGGVYFIEDIETSYWTRGLLYDNTFQYGYQNPRSLVERFKQIADIVNIEYLHEGNRKAFDSIAKSNGFAPIVLPMIRTITFGPNFISIAKKHPVDTNFDNRTYRLSSCL